MVFVGSQLGNDNLPSSSGQVGTMSTEELQSQIKSLIAELNWKLPKLAEVLFVAFNDDDVCDENIEIEKFYEKLKGHLKRKSTPPGLLKNYINIITNNSEYIKSNVVVPKYIPAQSISESLRSELELTSKAITRRISGNDL